MAKKTESDLEILKDKLEGMRVAMLTSRDGDGTLHTRPMAAQEIEDDAELWFFTDDRSAKADEIARDPQVAVAFADPGDSKYVSISGRADLVHDPAKVRELWNPFVKAWFPDGPETPGLALLRVRIDRAEYWDSPSSTVVKLAGLAKALATGERADDLGENRKLDPR